MPRELGFFQICSSGPGQDSLLQNQGELFPQAASAL